MAIPPIISAMQQQKILAEGGGEGVFCTWRPLLPSFLCISPLDCKTLNIFFVTNKHPTSHLHFGGLHTFLDFDGRSITMSRASNVVHHHALYEQQLSSHVTKHSYHYSLDIPPATGYLIKIMTLSSCSAKLDTKLDTPITVHAAGSRTLCHIGAHQKWVHTSVFFHSN